MCSWKNCRTHCAESKYEPQNEYKYGTCSTTAFCSSGSTSWKFFTDAIVTLPLKFNTYAPTCSFQRGGLLMRYTRSRRLRSFMRVRMSSPPVSPSPPPVSFHLMMRWLSSRPVVR